MFNKASLIALAILSTAAHATENNKYQYNYSLVSGSVPANWQKSDTKFGPWENSGSVFDCSNWSPSTSTVGKGISFVQTATDCKLLQERWAQDYERNNLDGKTRTSGDQYTVYQTIITSTDRDAVGILENWETISPSYTGWTNTNALYGCSSWAPNPSTYTSSANFTQTSSNCRTDQQRTRQNREQERYTLEIRNVGNPTTEYQTLNGQSASRIYSVSLSGWTNSGSKYGCSNWSPDPSTVDSGQSFVQTATDCEQNQTRNRSESYVDHKTGSTIAVSSTTENQVLNGQTDTRNNTGTKPVALVPSVYITGTSSAGKNKCTNQIVSSGSISWSGTNVSYYTFNGTNVGLATSRSVNPGTYTVVAYSSTGHTASTTGTVSTYTINPSQNCNK